MGAAEVETRVGHDGADVAQMVGEPLQLAKDDPERAGFFPRRGAAQGLQRQAEGKRWLKELSPEMRSASRIFSGSGSVSKSFSLPLWE